MNLKEAKNPQSIVGCSTGYTSSDLYMMSLILTRKEIKIIFRLFLVIAMYCQASSRQFNQSLNLPCS